jgi:hypothetical protein
MSRRLSLALLTGILAIPLWSTGSVPSSSHAVRKGVPAAIGSRAPLIPIRGIRTRQRGPRSQSSPRTPAVRSSREEPAVVILYGDRPWSWM